MSKKVEITYEWAKKFTKDKDSAIENFIRNTLNKTQSMFVYDGLPDTLPQSELETLLQRNGQALIAEYDGDLYAFDGANSGKQDAYGNATEFIVSNPWLNFNHTFTIDVDSVLIKNDYERMGLMPIIGKYAALMLDTDISLNTLSILSRIAMLISAPDDSSRASADLFISKILDGDYSIISDNAFFDGVKLQSPNSSNALHTQDLIELMQYYRATLYNELGLQSNYNMKREKLSATEAAMNIDILLPLLDNMMFCRQTAIDKVNAMFGTNISVDYGSSWATTQQQDEQSKDFAATIIDTANGNDNVSRETIETASDDTETASDDTETASDNTETASDDTETASDDTDESDGKDNDTD